MKEIVRRAALVLLIVPAVSTLDLRAQRREAAQPVEQARTQIPEDRDARETRQRLMNILQQYPPSLSQVLRLDPSLVANTTYLAPYPTLAAFLAQHPEVAHNPSFFLGAVREESWNSAGAEKRMAIELWGGIMAGIAGFTGALILIGVLGWLIRTLIDYRRWLRLSRIQTDVHTKLLDRFTNNEDLLAYMQTSTGRRFLESAPIPIDAGPRVLGAPVGRILWSVQAGVVLAMGGAGLSYVSGRVVEEMREPLFVVGSLAMALGLGFIVSSVIAFLLARQLGLMDRTRRDDGEVRPQTAS
jgi:hypothetical protein